MPGFVDKTRGRAVRGIRAVPQFRPAEDGQGRAGQASLPGLDQVELAVPVLVDFIAGAAQVQRHSDMAVE
ncbi:hypothetical protein D3C84_1240790 [compost metagenome]